MQYRISSHDEVAREKNEKAMKKLKKTNSKKEKLKQSKGSNYQPLLSETMEDGDGDDDDLIRRRRVIGEDEWEGSVKKGADAEVFMMPLAGLGPRERGKESNTTTLISFRVKGYEWSKPQKIRVPDVDGCTKCNPKVRCSNLTWRSIFSDALVCERF
mgnify:CR=1 FL=1